MDLIDREALLKKLENKEIVRLDKNGLCDIDEVLSIVGYGTPTVDAAPVVHGKWFDGECDDGGELWYCSRCNYPVKTIAGRPAFDYCPHCGAKMDEVSE